MQKSGLALELDKNGNIIASDQEIRQFFELIRTNSIVIPSGLPVIYFDSIKFESCVYNNLKPEIRVSSSCCEPIFISGFRCQSKDLFGIKPEQCFQCHVYKSKT